MTISLRRPDAGIALAEAIGALVLFGILMGALTYGTATLFKFQARPEVQYSGATYTLAPSFTDFNAAVSLHAAFTVAVDQSDNLIVLGGARSHPVNDPVGPSSTLQLGFGDTSLNAAAGSDPAAALSSWDQRQVNNAQFASALTTTSDPADFTVLTVQGQSRITSITQQRRHTAVINGESVVLYEVTHQAVDWSSGSPVLVPNANTGVTPTYAYRIYYDATDDHWNLSPGASHFWYRTDTAWDRDQEGPARVIFADPYILAGSDAQAQIAAMSRFVYFLPQCR